MKKLEISLFVLGFLFALLFYKQEAGLNYAIFSISTVALTVLVYRERMREPLWLLSAFSVLYTGISVFMVGSDYSIIMNLLSLIVFSTQSMSARPSVIISFINGVYSWLSAYIYLPIHLFKVKHMKSGTQNLAKQTILASLIVLLVIFMFFSIYKSVNPTFKAFIDEWKFNIEIGFLLTWIWGIFISFSLLKNCQSNKLLSFDSENRETINETLLNSYDSSAWGKIMSFKIERVAGIVMLFLLNGMLLLANTTDFIYLCQPNGLPNGLTKPEFVHQGVGMLIFSILLSIAILSFVFRGHGNFGATSKILKMLAIVWIIQNAIMIFFTMNRNLIYVHEYGLTFKRTGVFVYLLLCIVGLTVTGFKILKNKKTWFLVGVNSTWFFYILMFLAPINWTKMITNYNIVHADKSSYWYLSGLGFSNYDLIYDKIKENEKLYIDDRFNIQSDAELKIIEFYHDYENHDWQSWCLDKSRVHKNLKIRNK